MTATGGLGVFGPDGLVTTTTAPKPASKAPASSSKKSSEKGGLGCFGPNGEAPTDAAPISKESPWDLFKDGDPVQLQAAYEEMTRQPGGSRIPKTISKSLGYLLRHAASNLGVEIRSDGYAPLSKILQAPDFRGKYTVEQVMATVWFDTKQRYTMIREQEGGDYLMRANQGHTMKQVKEDELLEIVPDDTQIDAVHGTYLVHWPFIKEQGLSRAARNHIHLAMGLPGSSSAGAKIKGMRSSAEVYISIDVNKAQRDGVIFYQSRNEVILTDGLQGWLAPKYFKVVQTYNFEARRFENLDFDRTLDHPPWDAELAPCGPEVDVYTIKNMESMALKAKRKVTEAEKHKARKEEGEELTKEEQDQVDQLDFLIKQQCSLEQRKRQQGGARDKHLQGSLNVEAKDRNKTPPWEKAGPGGPKRSAGGNDSDKEAAAGPGQFNFNFKPKRGPADCPEHSGSEDRFAPRLNLKPGGATSSTAGVMSWREREKMRIERRMENPGKAGTIEASETDSLNESPVRRLHMGPFGPADSSDSDIDFSPTPCSSDYESRAGELQSEGLGARTASETEPNLAAEKEESRERPNFRKNSTDRGGIPKGTTFGPPSSDIKPSSNKVLGAASAANKPRPVDIVPVGSGSSDGRPLGEQITTQEVPSSKSSGASQKAEEKRKRFSMEGTTTGTTEEEQPASTAEQVRKSSINGPTLPADGKTAPSSSPRSSLVLGAVQATLNVDRPTTTGVAKEAKNDPTSQEDKQALLNQQLQEHRQRQELQRKLREEDRQAAAQAAANLQQQQLLLLSQQQQMESAGAVAQPITATPADSSSSPLIPGAVPPNGPAATASVNTNTPPSQGAANTVVVQDQQMQQQQLQLAPQVQAMMITHPDGSQQVVMVPVGPQVSTNGAVVEQQLVPGAQQQQLVAAGGVNTIGGVQQLDPQQQLLAAQQQLLLAQQRQQQLGVQQQQQLLSVEELTRQAQMKEQETQNLREVEQHALQMFAKGMAFEIQDDAGNAIGKWDGKSDTWLLRGEVVQVAAQWRQPGAAMAATNSVNNGATTTNNDPAQQNLVAQQNVNNATVGPPHNIVAANLSEADKQQLLETLLRALPDEGQKQLLIDRLNAIHTESGRLEYLIQLFQVMQRQQQQQQQQLLLQQQQLQQQQLLQQQQIAQQQGTPVPQSLVVGQVTGMVNPAAQAPIGTPMTMAVPMQNFQTHAAAVPPHQGGGPARRMVNPASMSSPSVSSVSSSNFNSFRPPSNKGGGSFLGKGPNSSSKGSLYNHSKGGGKGTPSRPRSDSAGSHSSLLLSRHSRQPSSSASVSGASMSHHHGRASRYPMSSSASSSATTSNADDALGQLSRKGSGILSGGKPPRQPQQEYSNKGKGAAKDGSNPQFRPHGGKQNHSNSTNYSYNNASPQTVGGPNSFHLRQGSGFSSNSSAYNGTQQTSNASGYQGPGSHYNQDYHANNHHHTQGGYNNNNANHGKGSAAKGAAGAASTQQSRPTPAQDDKRFENLGRMRRAAE